MNDNVANYSKGARGERELLAILHENKYAVMRSAGSGINSISPDLIAIKEGKGLAFECKAWDSTSISIPHEKYESLLEWERNTFMPMLIGWRMNAKGWYFIKLSELTKTEKSYTVTMKNAMAINRRIEAII